MNLNIELEQQEEIQPYIITLSNGKQITLNDEQVYALSKGMEFLADRNKKYFCISGSAGTGKSTILKELIRGWERKTCITAPTHEAVEVIGTMTGLKAETLHKLLGLRPDMDLEDFDSKNMLFSQLATNNMMEYSLICVDESSMINEDLLNIIKNSSRGFGVKIIFMGDRMQLPPVNLDFSPVFYDEDIEQVQLIKVERQAGCNPLMKVYDNILSNILSEKDLFPYEDDVIVDDGKELGIRFNKTYESFAEQIIKHLTSEEYNQDRSLYKILCYENNTVKKWNNYVRKMIYGGISEPFKDGEVLKSYTAIYDYDMQMMKLRNSGEYFISDIQEDKFLYEEYINKHNSNFIELTGFRMTLNPVNHGIGFTFFVMDMTDENKKKFVPIEQKLYWKAKKASPQERKWMWMEYYKFRSSCLITETMKVDPLERDTRYPNKKHEIKKDLDFAYALTIHKSQGRTYKSVFIDGKDVANLRKFSTSKKPTHFLANRLNYVALSRPTDMAYVNV